ncbi:GSU2403 family nucleotidyltransferase fold protein [Hyphomicrobium sulfonivorans]|uniref:GSU2403 family nucleotidyltransferase fold protein n=1 Tax=Hyphomicrobium sulfonivorans TaxID=121290 RepID=UPI00156D832A|nr:GSU2403 family nucleotidyltransferase fold protein [Hyphomicrobium sulfonivorans]MBI1649048.1 hypothetical protein [Hyphomicrobium sulfonivorans]NSL70418.1 hypothetical protein [Hyphomicrobium sulfonivorans]
MVLPVELPELSLEQRRQLIDVQQRFESWRAAERAFEESNKGSMTWKRVGGRQYLYRIVDRYTHKSLGPRTAETEQLKQDYMTSRTANRSRITKLRKALEKSAPINRAMGLARVPRAAAKILRALDQARLLGDGLFVVGTHALYAYEARSGLVFQPELLATTDIDFLADVRSRLVLAIEDKKRTGILAALLKADPSFTVQGDLFRAVNDEGYFVDIIRPMAKNEMMTAEYDLGGIVPAGIDGLQWLVSSPRFEASAIAEDGMPVWMSCIDPRAFALHKRWVSLQTSREPLKRRRDAAQAIAVAKAASLLGLQFDAKELSALPAKIFEGADALLAGKI